MSDLRPFVDNEDTAFVVGQTPWSARDAHVPHFLQAITPFHNLAGRPLTRPCPSRNIHTVSDSKLKRRSALAFSIPLAGS